eukprot:6769606-Prymnesium_polylepis.1
MPNPHASLSDPSTHTVTNMQTCARDETDTGKYDSRHTCTGPRHRAKRRATERPAQHDSCAL